MMAVQSSGSRRLCLVSTRPVCWSVASRLLVRDEAVVMSGVARAFSHLALVVTDVQKVTAFYVDAFGFERGAPWSSSGRRVAGLMDVEPDGFDGVYLALGDFRLELLSY